MDDDEKSQLNPSTASLPVVVLHTEAEVLLLSQNGTARSDWSASHEY